VSCWSARRSGCWPVGAAWLRIGVATVVAIASIWPPQTPLANGIRVGLAVVVCGPWLLVELRAARRLDVPATS
jgi:hypothetical protein